jgi:hypothetical protein
VEAQLAIIAPDCAVHLDSEPTIHVSLAVISLPTYLEGDCALRFNETLENAGENISEVGLQDEVQGVEYFLNSLVDFRFQCVFCQYLRNRSVEMKLRELDPRDSSSSPHFFFSKSLRTWQNHLFGTLYRKN